jgi:signal transduction histidine kinase
MAAVPLTVDGRVVGALGIDFPAGAAPTDDDRRLLLAFAQQCAQALERARLFEAERAAVAAAERANQAKSDFLATMSHELRTPLNAVIGYAELMALGIDGPLTPAQAGRLERIQSSSTHLRDLVNEVLDLAQIESGELALRVETAGVVVAVDAALALIAPQAAARGVELAAACGGERAARYLGDAQRVRQIVVNLLANAVRFTPAGGRVAVRCDAGESPMPDRLAPEPGPWLRLTVEDTGIGIAADHLEAIFEPFVQVESGLTRTRGGTGLGLAISRRLARAMGGELVVESEPGVGSRFTLWLRAARAGGTGEPPRVAAAR